MNTVVQISPLYTFLNQFLNILLQGVGVIVLGYAGYLYHKWTGVSLDTSASASLNKGLQNGVAIAMQKIEGAEDAHKDIDVKNAIVASAANYAMAHEADAVARFGLSPSQLANKALAYIPPPPVQPVAPVKAGG